MTVELEGLLEAMKSSLSLQDFLVSEAQEEGPRGFSAFYELVFGHPLPKHGEAWVAHAYDCHARGKGFVIQAFRGSTKTTTITIGLAAYRIGHHPEKAGLMIQVGDDIAQNNAQQVADIVDLNEGFKAVFPQVVPDRERGWGAAGYEVKDDSVPYSEWRNRNSKRKDPSFIGLGYKSRAIIGKHPDNFLFVDDIHDENNTLSQREREKVIKIVTGTIFPTVTPDTLKGFVGTPWTEDDILAYVEQTGEYEALRTPVVDADGNSAWPEVFDQQEIERRKRISGAAEFARMYLLDLEAAKVTGLKFHSYPHELIDPYRWEGGGGCDYASIIDAYQRSTGEVRDRNFFALAYGFKMPRGGLVVYDGVVEKGTQTENESHLKTAQNLFPNWRGSAVEGDGKGEEFISVAMRNPGLRLVPMKTGGKGKKQRLERQLGPWLENGLIRISDAETPFLDHLRKALSDYPNWHLDTLDAVYWLARLFQEVLTMPGDEGELPSPNGNKRKRPNPFDARNW